MIVTIVTMLFPIAAVQYNGALRHVEIARCLSAQ